MASSQATPPQSRILPPSETTTAMMASQPTPPRQPSSGPSQHKAPIQGPSLFSTNDGKIAPRPAPFPREQQIVRSDFKEAVLNHCNQLRKKHPLICNMVFAPWDIRTFFDEYDFYRYGGEFLYAVLTNLMQENGKRVVDFCKNYAEMNKTTYDKWYRATLPVEEMFARQDIEEYGVNFMSMAIKCLQECCQRAEAQHLAVIQKNLLYAGTSSDFSKAIPDGYYDNESRPSANNGGSFRGNQKMFSPEKNRGQDQHGYQNRTGTGKKKNSKVRRSEEETLLPPSSLPDLFTPPQPAQPHNMMNFQPTPFGIPSFTGPPLPGMFPMQFHPNMPPGPLHPLAPLANQPTVFVPHNFTRAGQDRGAWTERELPPRERGGSIRGRGRGGGRGNHGSNGSRRSSFGVSGDYDEVRPRRPSHGPEPVWRLRQTTSHPPILESQAETQDSAKSSNENAAPRVSPNISTQDPQKNSLAAAESADAKSESSAPFANQIPPALESNEVLKARPLRSGSLRSREGQQGGELTSYHVPENREDVVEVFVAGLPDIAEEDDVREIMSRYGTVMKILMKRSDPTKYKSPVFALVEFSDTAAVRRVLSSGHTLLGRSLVVKVSNRHLSHAASRRYSPQDVRSSLSPNMVATIVPPPTISIPSAALKASSSLEDTLPVEASVAAQAIPIERSHDKEIISMLDLGGHSATGTGTFTRGAANRRQERLKERASPTRKPTLPNALSSIGEDAEPVDSAGPPNTTEASVPLNVVDVSKEDQGIPRQTASESQTVLPTVSATPADAPQLSATAALEPVGIETEKDAERNAEPGHVAVKADSAVMSTVVVSDDEPPTQIEVNLQSSSDIDAQITSTLESPIEQAPPVAQSAVPFKTQKSRKSKSKTQKMPSIAPPSTDEKGPAASSTTAAEPKFAFNFEAPSSDSSKVSSLNDLLGGISIAAADTASPETNAKTDTQQELTDTHKASFDKLKPPIVIVTDNATKTPARVDSAMAEGSASLAASLSTKSAPFGGSNEIPPELRKLSDAIEKAKKYKPYQPNHAADLKVVLASCKRKFNSLRSKIDDLATSTPGGSSKTMNKTKTKKLKKIQEDLNELEEEVAFDLKKYEFLQEPPETKDEQDKKKAKEEEEKKKAKDEQDRKKVEANKVEMANEGVGRSENGTYQHRHLHPREIVEKRYVPNLNRNDDRYNAIDDEEGTRTDGSIAHIFDLAGLVDKMDTDKKWAEEREQRAHPFPAAQMLRELNENDLFSNFPAKGPSSKTASQDRDVFANTGLGIFAVGDPVPSRNDLNKSPTVTSGTISPSSEQGDTSQGRHSKDLTAALKKAQDYDSTPRHLQIPPLNAPKVVSPPVTSPGPHSYARAASSSATPSIDSFIKKVDSKTAAAAKSKEQISSTSTRAPSTVRSNQKDGANDEDEWTAREPEWGPGGFKSVGTAGNGGGNEGQNTMRRKRGKGNGKAPVGGVMGGEMRKGG